MRLAVAAKCSQTWHSDPPCRDSSNHPALSALAARHGSEGHVSAFHFLFDSAKQYASPSQHDSTPIRLSLVPDNLLPSQSGLKQPDEEDKPTTTDLPLPALAIANFLRSCPGAGTTFDYQSH